MQCDQKGLDLGLSLIKGASFSSNKLTYIRTLCQNYVFTTAQVCLPEGAKTQAKVLWYMCIRVHSLAGKPAVIYLNT